MSYTTTYMGLTVWNLLSDLFDHTQLEGDLIAIDGHDHTNGHGKQIPTGGIADGSITDGKIAAATITGDKIATGTITGSNIANGTITDGLIANDTITYDKILSFMDFTTVTASATAVPSTVMNYFSASAGTITLPLPSGANTNTIFGFRNGGGGGNLTVACSGSAHIFGLGCNAASVSLGEAGSYMLLMSNGTGWLIVGGQQDTGWLPLTNFHSSVTSLFVFTDTTPAARLVGDRVFLRGNLITTNVTSIGPNPWALVPPALRPSYDVWFPGGNNVWGAGPSYQSITGCHVYYAGAPGGWAGGVTYDPADAETGVNPTATIYLDGVNWSLP